MAFGFQSSAFQGPGFQQQGGGASPSGGYLGSGEDYFFRPVKLGRDTVAADDERKLVKAVLDRVSDGAELDWTGGQPAFVRRAAVDWDALERLRAQSERLKQEAVLEAIRRVVAAVKAAEAAEDAQADERFAEGLLEDHNAELGAFIGSMLDQIARYNELRALTPPPAPVVEPEPEPEPVETAESVMVGILRDMVRLMGARKEVVTDASGRAVAVRSVFADMDLPPDMGGALAVLRGELDRAMVPKEVVRDDSFRIVGLKTIN